MKTVTSKQMIKLAVASAKRAMKRYSPNELAKGLFVAERFFAVHFSSCTEAEREEMLTALQATEFYKNRMATA